MADMEFSKSADDERYLLISFVEGRPMTALQVSNLLRDLNSDYRRLTGRDLVLAHLEVGSTWLWLVDAATEAGSWIKGAASVAKASQDLGTFAKKLKDSFKPVQQLGPIGAPFLPDEVEKSVTSMAKIAEETNSTIRVRKQVASYAGTESIDITVSPAQAKQFRKKLKDRPKLQRAITHSAPPLITEQNHQIAKRLSELPPATRELEGIIDALVQAHMSIGTVSVLKQVADILDTQGRHDIANIIRKHLPRGRNEIETES